MEWAKDLLIFNIQNDKRPINDSLRITMISKKEIKQAIRNLSGLAVIVFLMMQIVMMLVLFALL